MPLTPASPARRNLEAELFSPCGAEQSVEYLCQKYEALQKQLASVERNCAEQVQRQELLQRELRSLRDAQQPQDAERHASLVKLRAAARRCQQEQRSQTGRLAEEQLAGARAEQRCQELAEECQQRSRRYDQKLQQLAQQDRDIAMHRFEAVSTSRRLEQTQADAQVVKEDVRVESQRQLLAQGELNDLEKSLQAACHQLMLSDQELERLQRALADRKQEVMDCDAQLLSTSEALDSLQQQKQRQTQSLARLEEDCQQLDQQLHAAQQDLLRGQGLNEQQAAEIKSQAALCDSLKGDLCQLEKQRSMARATAEATSQGICDVEAAIKDSRLHSIQVFRERDVLMQQVSELKAEQQQLDGLCLALRRAVHAEGLIMEDMETELQMAFKRKESLLQDIAVNSQTSLKMEKDLDQLRPELAEADQRSASLETSLVQKSKQLEDELLRERSLRQDLARSALAI